ncbi:hypothetical protein [Kitasatospora herbaricolor]|uniref:Uncharacterized protein n=1 Tax=Kitasatospora herbaricolor TaxID=68217 RepID=A0ABZ1WJA2_9ACTN|nr:hypothetical protein [Kitasatospora herbaricolor]
MSKWRARGKESVQASWVEDRIVIEADSGQSLTVVFEPMGSSYEIRSGLSLTVVFFGPVEHPGCIDYQSDYVSVDAGVVGSMAVFDAAGDELDLGTGMPY